MNVALPSGAPLPDVWRFFNRQRVLTNDQVDTIRRVLRSSSSTAASRQDSATTTAAPEPPAGAASTHTTTTRKEGSKS